MADKWLVYVDENFHYMDEDERWLYGEFDTYEAAVAVCKELVDRDIDGSKAKAADADALYEHYTLFGDDPFIVGPEQGTKFSAWDYAKQRCKEVYQS